MRKMQEILAELRETTARLSQEFDETAEGLFAIDTINVSRLFHYKREDGRLVVDMAITEVKINIVALEGSIK